MQRVAIRGIHAEYESKCVTTRIQMRVDYVIDHVQLRGSVRNESPSTWNCFGVYWIVHLVRGATLLEFSDGCIEERVGLSTLGSQGDATV